MYDTAFTVGIALFMLRYVGMEAVYQRAKWTGSGLRFPTAITLRVLFRVGAPLLLYASFRVFEESEIFVAATGGILGLACLLWEPGEISTDGEGVKYKRYFGLQKRFIPWGSVVASYLPAVREVLVIGKNGVHFTHTQYHVGQDEFVRELRRHGVFFHGDPISGNPRKK
jgi:hypothetical protein